MRNAIISAVVVASSVFLFQSGIALADPAVLNPAFEIEKFADVNFPIGLEIPPPSSAFGDFLYVSSMDGRLEPGSGPPDRIFRIDLSTRSVTTFFELPPESDPTVLVFGPGAPFTTNLYISSNNRDGNQPGDYGGSIVFLEPDPSINGEIFLTPIPPPTVLSEPGYLAFGPGGDFGTDLYVGNTADIPHDIATISPAGARGSFIDTEHSWFTLTFGPGGVFGSDLYVMHQDTGDIFTVDPDGIFTLFTSISDYLDYDFYTTIAFAPAGPFGGDLYVGASQASGPVSILRIDPTGSVSEFATGFIGASFYPSPELRFPNGDGLAFSNDGESLFVSDMLGNAIYRIFEYVEPAVSVSLDIKPGTCPNSYNLKAKGPLPLAVLGTMDFDVNDIDTATILMEGVPPLRSSFKDVGTPFDGEPCDCHDLEGDGYVDLALKFDPEEIMAAVGPVSDGDEIVLTLTGELTDGTPFQGEDCILILDKGKK